MEFKGVVQVITPTEFVGKDQKPKKVAVLKEVKDQYAQSISVDFMGDKEALLDGVSIGDIVNVHLNIYSNEYNGKYYNSIRAWKLELISKGEEDPI